MTNTPVRGRKAAFLMNGADTLVPGTPEQLADFLNDPGRAANVMRSPEKLAEFMNKYSEQQWAKDGSMRLQVKEEVQRGMLDFARSQTNPEHFAGPAVPAEGLPDSPLGSAGRFAAKNQLFNRKALGAKVMNEPFAKDFASHWKAIWPTNYVPDAVAKYRKLLLDAMSEKVPADGGFLVPENLRSELLRVALESAVARPRARVVPMESLRVPYPTVDDTSHVSNVYGGFAGYWTEEAAAISASQPSFSRVVLDAKKLALYTEIPNELLNDSAVTLQQFLSEIGPEAVSFFEDDAFINGSGQGEPQGILNANCGVSVTRTTTSKVKVQDLFNMFSRMLPRSLPTAVWMCPPDVLPQLFQLVMPTGDATTTYVAPPLWLNGQSVQGGPVMQILGRPLIITEKAPALGSTGDLSFVDWSYYLLGDRQVMQASSSDQFKFSSDVTAFRIIERADGRPWINSAITPKNNSANTLSPVVTLHS